MVKDPLDNGQTQDIVFPEITELAPEFKTTLTEAQAAAIVAAIRNLTFSQRNPTLGKMVNCPIHGFRHRTHEFDPVNGCVQTFTYRVKDKDGRLMEHFREDSEKGTLVPDLRTAIPVDARPTMKQIVGAASTQKKRFKTHYSKMRLQFIERVRVVYDQLEFGGHNLLLPMPKSKLQTARVIAARQIRAEHEQNSRRIRRQQDQSRRINRGLKIGRNRP